MGLTTCRLGLISAVLLCWTAGAACAQAGTSTEGPFAFRKTVPIRLSVGSKGQGDLVRLSQIAFIDDRQEGHVYVNIWVSVTSWPKGKWRIDVELLGALDKILGHTEGVLENAGVVAGTTVTDQGYLVMVAGVEKDADPRRFRLSMKQVSDNTPVTLSLSGEPWRLEQSGLRDIDMARLDQMAVLIDSVSKGQARLLLVRGTGARPLGGVFRVTGQPWVFIAPASRPVLTRLPGIGNAAILGATANWVPVSAPEGKDRVAEGGYLLAYQGDFSNRDEEKGSMALVSVIVDGQGQIILKEALRTPAVRNTRSDDVLFSGEDFYGVTIRFPGDKEISKDNPGNRAHVFMALEEEDGRYRSYSFSFDVSEEGAK